MEGGQLIAIREEKDATPDGAGASASATPGVMALPRRRAAADPEEDRQRQRQGRVLPHRRRRHRQRATAQGRRVVEADADEVAGVNTRARARRGRGHLAAARARSGDGRRRDPDRPEHGLVRLRHQARPRRDDRAERLLRPRRDDRRRRHRSTPFCHIEGATIASGAIVGPFARLRPGAAIGEKAQIGNFVEVKNADDRRRRQGQPSRPTSATPRSARGANIGAGTITCNYDGFDKYRTEIGAGAFIGSNTRAGRAGARSATAPMSPPAA